jgi:hypothetical protein
LGVDLQDGGLGSGAGADADVRQFLIWSANLPLDPDVSQDARMMVPIFYDGARKQTKLWVFLGWSAQGLTVSFTKEPTVTVTSASSWMPRSSMHAFCQPVCRWRRRSSPKCTSANYWTARRFGATVTRIARPKRSSPI